MGRDPSDDDIEEAAWCARQKWGKGKAKLMASFCCSCVVREGLTAMKICRGEGLGPSEAGWEGRGENVQQQWEILALKGACGASPKQEHIQGRGARNLEPAFAPPVILHGANPIVVSVCWLQPSLCFAICMETFFVWTLLPAVGVPAHWGPPAEGQMQCGVRTQRQAWENKLLNSTAQTSAMAC